MSDQIITAEQIEEAASYLASVYGPEPPLGPAGDQVWRAHIHRARAAFRAIGFRIEGDET